VFFVIFIAPHLVFANGLGKDFPNKVECAQHLQFYFNGDDNVYSGLDPEPFLLFLPAATGLPRPLYISHSKTGYMASPIDWKKGFRMNGGCVNPLDWSWDELRPRRKCPYTTIDRSWDDRISEFLSVQLLARIKMVSDIAKEEIEKNKRDPELRSLASHTPNRVVQMHRERLQKCVPLLNQPQNKMIRDAIRSEIQELTK